MILNPGIYVIAGGGLSVSGDAMVTGSEVMIYNAGSKFPAAGGKFGGFTVNGRLQYGHQNRFSFFSRYRGVLLFATTMRCVAWSMNSGSRQ